MAQHDYVIANGTGAAVRSDLNNGLAAIVSQNSGTTEPTTTYAYMRWADTTAGVMKMRNGANNAWITLYQLDGEWSTIAFENGSASAPSIYFKDSGTDTGIYSPGTDQVAISTNGTGRLFVNSSGSVGIGTSSPQSVLNISAASGGDTSGLRITRTDAGGGDWRIWSTATANGEGAGKLIFGNSANRVTIDGSGNVGIGTTSPSTSLHVSNASNAEIRLGSGSYDAYIGQDSAGVLAISQAQAGSIKLQTNGSERARIDSSGRLLVGTSSTSAGLTALLQGNSSSATSNAGLMLARGETPSVDGTVLGALDFAASNHVIASRILCKRDAGTWTAGSSQPTRLEFSTCSDGSASPTERMRIRNNGRVFINTTDGVSPTVANTSFADFGGASSNFGLWLQSHDGTTLYVNRQADDGAVIEIRQAGTLEGTISVSGTTVTYGGGHLARWSQLPNNEDPSTLLKGTVMSNLDEMCDWGEEDNEQLNKTKISDVEGDKNVAGVFVSTSFNDDGPLDFFVGMTGDMVIRIAEGVTVERGDLLMSAGDGTAKPQDDDIIRSKTIAKVTSTNVSCTYDDGSYCVPCVLMAC